MNECLYEEAKVKTKTQILQSRIRELEAKIRRMAEKDKDKEREKQPSQPQLGGPFAMDTGISLSSNNVPLTTSPEPSPVPQFPHQSSNGLRHSQSSASASSSSLDPFAVTGSLDNVEALFGAQAASSLDSFPSSSWGSSSSSDFQFSTDASSLSLWSGAQTDNADTWGLSTMPTPVPSVYTVGSAAFPANPIQSSSSSSLTATAPSNLGLLVPNVDLTSTSTISSPSLSSAMTHSTVNSSVSSPPSVSWEDDLRLSALDLSRQLDMEDVPVGIAQELLVHCQTRRLHTRI